MSLRLPGAASAVLVACALVTSACSIDSSGLGGTTDGGTHDGSVDGPPIPSDAGPECRTFAAPRVVAVVGEDDFTAGELAAVQVDEAGHLVLTHELFRHGALLFTAYVDPLLNPSMPSFTDVDGAGTEGRALYGDFDQVLDGDTTPPGYLGSHVNWTTVGEGEIELEPGTHVLTLTGDDVAMAEVSIDGAPQTVTAWLATTEVRFDVPEPGGWYPFRVAWMDYGSTAVLRIEHTRPSGEMSILDPARLRAGVGDVEGREMWGWDSIPHDDSPDGSRIDTSRSREPSFGPDEYPGGLGLTDKNDFAVVWAGRHRLPRTFSTLGGDANERFRVWVDGTLLGEGRTLDRELPLLAGWYDVVLEYEETGDATQRYQLLADREPFEPADMRPVTRFGGRPFGIASSTAATIPAGGSGDISLSLQAPSDSDDPACAVEVSAIVETVDAASVGVSVTMPDGTVRGPFPLGSHSFRAPRTDVHHFRTVLRDTELPPSPSGSWVITVANDAVDDAERTGAAVLAHHGCDGRPYPNAGSFTSATIDLGRDHRIDRIVTSAQRSFGTSVRTRLRVGRTPAELAAAVGWLTTAADGTLERPLVGRYVQLELQLSGPGYDTPRVVDARVVGAPCIDCVAEGTCREPVLDGLLALYTFDEAEGRRVLDVSGAGEPLDLFIGDPDAVTRGGGALRVNSPTVIRSVDRDDEIYAALVASDELTVETVIVPSLASQPMDTTPPARIVTYSYDMSGRNFTLGQELTSYVIRLRTTDGDDEGREWLFDPENVEVAPTYVAFTYSAATGLVLYVNGEERASLGRTGAFDGWDPRMELALANEPDDVRHFLGEYRWVAIYDRALPRETIRRNYEALAP